MKEDNNIKRFDELEKSWDNFAFQRWEFGEKCNDDIGFVKWRANALHLINCIYDENSDHYLNFSKHSEKVPSNLNSRTLFGLFLAAKDDYEKGFFKNMQYSISSEIFTDLIVLAKECLENNNLNGAAILAAVALEDTLKKFAELKGLNAENKDLDGVVGLLKSHGLLEGAEAKLIAPYIKVRNQAVHAEWEKIQESAVGSMIGYVENFLLSKF